MIQNIIIPIDHGNRNIKTENFEFTSGLIESEIKPPIGRKYLLYNDKYYTLSEKRIPYMRDKSTDTRFFILSLFGIAMELEREHVNTEDMVKIDLPVGLPPKHYGSLYEKYEKYFKNKNDAINFMYNGKRYNICINKVMAFPQDYAAAMTIFKKIMNHSKTIVIDIGGFTVDYLLLRKGEADLSVCDSLENGVIKLYGDIISKVNSEYDILLEETDIDSILKSEDICISENIVKMVENMSKCFAEDLLGTLREKGLNLKIGVVFVGGGSLLLQRFLEKSDKVENAIFIDDIKANAKGYSILYKAITNRG